MALGLIISLFAAALAFPNETEIYLKRLDTATNISKIDILNDLAEIYFRNSISIAKKYCEEALKLAYFYNYDEGICRGFITIGSVLTSEGNYSEAEKILNQALEIAEKKNLLKLKADALMNISFHCQNLARFNEVFDNYNKAFNIYESISDSNGLRKSYYNLSRLCMIIKDFELAMLYAEKGLSISRNSGDLVFRGNFLRLIGSLYFQLSDNKQAMNFLNKSWYCLENTSDFFNKCTTLFALAGLHVELKNLDSAIYYTKKGIDIGLEGENNEKLSELYTMLSHCYSLTGDYKKELKYNLLALNLREKLGMKVLVASSLINVGNTYLNMKNYQSCRLYLMRAADLCKANGFLYYLQSAYEKLARLFRFEGNYRESYNYILLNSQVKDSLNTISTKLYLSKKYIQNELANKVNIINKLEDDKKNSTIYSLAAISGLGIILIIVLLWLYRSKHKANLLLDLKVRQRTSELEREISERKKIEEELKQSVFQKEILLKEVHHRVKNNLQLIKSMLRLQSRYLTNDNALELFLQSQDRIMSIALIHEKLYRTENLKDIDFGEYIKSLTSSLCNSLSINPGKVSQEIKADTIILDIEKAMPLGLILNELISNAFIHAFPGEHSGRIAITAENMPDNSVEIVVADNGIGMPENVNIVNPDSFGLKMVKLLCEQIEAEFSFGNNNGAVFHVKFYKY